MQKIFIKRLIITVFVFMIGVLTIGYFWSAQEAITATIATSKIKINQIEQIVLLNLTEIETLKEATREDYLSRAEAVAYIVTNNPKVAKNNKELTKIAELMQIDEIHIFDAQGIIRAGTVEGYIGVGVDDGIQIGYFKQILHDPSLKLVQDISPATADGKMMQYIGLGRRDEAGIIQIGMRPERMLEVLKRNDLPDVISTVITDVGENIYIVDKKTGEVLASTDTKFSELNFYDFNFNEQKFEKFKKAGYVESDNARGFSVLKESNDILICIFKNRTVLLESARVDVLQMAFFLLLISISMILVINWLLERHVVLGIKKIIYTLKKITEGNLATVVTVNNNPEFKELSTQINTMVGYLLNSTSKISHVIDAVDLNIGMYEYRNDMEKVFATSRLANILGLSDSEALSALSDRSLFQKKLTSIYQGKCDKEDKMTYQISSEKKEHYIKINSFTDNITTLGIAVDVTDDVLRRHVIIQERDYDILSNLYNRRAFMRESEQLFSDKKNLKIACILIADMDNLKNVNDKYGHQTGDRYIKAGVDIICKVKNDSSCIMARLGGDEFVIMWYGYNNQDEIMEKINKLEKDINRATININEEKKYPVHFSAGYAFCPEQSAEKNHLLHIADMAMYCAKHKKEEKKFLQYTIDMEKEKYWNSNDSSSC